MSALTRWIRSRAPRATAPALDFDSWVAYGYVRGWCSDVVCDTHEGVPVNDEERALQDDGWDPCIPAIRLWGDAGAMSPSSLRSGDDLDDPC